MRNEVGVSIIVHVLALKILEEPVGDAKFIQYGQLTDSLNAAGRF